MGLRLRRRRPSLILATELGDGRRFTTPRQLAAYSGFVPREDASGDRERKGRKGAITKARDAHCRHALIQAASSYRYAPKVAAHLQARQLGQPPGVIAHA